LDRDRQRRAGGSPDGDHDAHRPNPKAMGELTLPRLPTILGWSATAVMTLATALFFASLI
jgi:hypothetical protein